MSIRTDDDICRQTDVFKGNEHFQIPFDARYGAWAVAVPLAATATVVVSKLFMPAFSDGGVIAVIASLLVAAVAAVPVGFFFHKNRPAQWKLLTVGSALVVFMPLYQIMSNGGPRGALTGLAMSILFGAGGSVLAVKYGGKYVDAVTPWRYRLAVAKAEIHAPRPEPVTTRTVTVGLWVEDVPPTSHVVLPPSEKAI